MKKSLVKVQVPVSSDYTDEHLKFIKQMGVDNCFVMFTDQDSNYDGVNKFLERCRKAGLTVNDIDYVLPHQANIRIIDAAKKRFNIPDEKVLTNISSYGNMSATSIAVLLDENARSGKFKKGDKLLFVAFGAGMTAAAAILTWNK